MALPDRLFEEPTDPRSLYAPAPVERVEALREIAVEALGSLTYLDLDSSSIEPDPRQMIHLHLSSKGQRPVSAIQADLRSVWRSAIARSKSSLHVFRSTDEGFDFRFALLDQGDFITGVFSVVVDSPSNQAAVEVQDSADIQSERTSKPDLR